MGNATCWKKFTKFICTMLAKRGPQNLKLLVQKTFFAYVWTFASKLGFGWRFRYLHNTTVEFSMCEIPTEAMHCIHISDIYSSCLVSQLIALSPHTNVSVFTISNSPMVHVSASQQCDFECIIKFLVVLHVSQSIDTANWIWQTGQFTCQTPCETDKWTAALHLVTFTQSLYRPIAF